MGMKRPPKNPPTDPKRGEPYHWRHEFDGGIGFVTFSHAPTAEAPHWCPNCALAHSIERCPYPPKGSKQLGLFE